MLKTIFITGATSGFGRATAEKFAAAGHTLIITGRRENKLNELAETLRNTYEVTVHSLCFDVQNKQACFENIASLKDKITTIDVLVNNAGLALGRDNFADANLADWEIMIDTNLKGLMYITKTVLPYMIAQNGGHIINIGSTAGKEVYENGNGYCASKHAVDALSKAMRIDLLKYAIKVTAIHPGAAETEFSNVRFKGDDDKAAKVYEGYKALQASDVADVIFYAANLPAHVCLNEIVMTCTAQANSFYLVKTST
jgi:3-hydroxy acid dehydrogenase / malonic semialdehyde reductase